MGSDVSVVIPTRDRAELLRQTLRSVHEQTLAPAEIIVADDGSRDHTAAVAEKFSCRRLHNPGGGWGAAGGRNAGLERVETEFVLFLDSDDLLLPGAIAALREALSAAPRAPFAFGRGLVARAATSGWSPEGLIAPRTPELRALPASLFARNFVPSSGALVRTEAARGIGGFPTASHYNEDFYFWVRLCLRGLPVHAPTIVSVYRVHAGNRFIPSAGEDYEIVRELGHRHGELAPGLAPHFGGRLCEHVIDAAHRRDALSLVRGAVQILRLTPDRGQTLRDAVRHLRVRRSFARAGVEAVRVLPELGGWLATYETARTTETDADGLTPPG
jgi:glycosyltransferase involved in cell wall biosynthesis